MIPGFADHRSGDRTARPDSTGQCRASTRKDGRKDDDDEQTFRSQADCFCPGMLIGAIPEWRSPSPEYAITWDRDDAPGLTVLKECGFVFNPDELPEDTRRAMADEEDPTCLAELQDDIGKNETLMRLFLERKRGEYLDPGYVKSLVLSGRMQAILSANEAGVEHLRRVVDECFPSDFTVSDACLTNAEFIWFHKHSYL